MQTLFILNDAPYGSERSYNAPRFSKALAQRVDAPCCLHESNRDQMRYDFLPLLAGREHEMASVRCDSLHAKLLPCPDEIEIYPQHQAGRVCGAGRLGKPDSTLGFEKRWSPALSMERAAFIESLTKEIPPRPAEMGAMVRLTLGLES